MPRLSAFLITKNEAQDLPSCLESIRACADEIVVVDDLSTDDTVEICRRHGARVYSRPLDGFGPQKQFALEQTTGDWALSLDADERLTPELAREIRQTLARPEPSVAFALRRHLFFLGRRLRFGGVGSDWSVRLLKRGHGRFRDLLIHESLEVDGPCGRLRHPVNHFSYATLEEYLAKRSLYTVLSAEQAYRRGRRFSRFDHLRPAWEIFTRVILRGAWLDGQPGIIYAMLSADTAWLRAVRLWEMEKARRQAPPIRTTSAPGPASDGPAAEGRREPGHSSSPPPCPPAE